MSNYRVRRSQARNVCLKVNLNLLQLNAEVVWSNVNMPRDEVVNRGMGIRFIINEKKERQLLQDAINAASEKTDESIEGK